MSEKTDENILTVGKHLSFDCNNEMNNTYIGVKKVIDNWINVKSKRYDLVVQNNV